MKLKIYQIKDFAHCKYVFQDYDSAKEKDFNFSQDYKCVWEEEVDSDISLEDIFTRFNIDRPTDFKGHSLSVSDIVDLEGHKFYCNSCGWEELNIKEDVCMTYEEKLNVIIKGIEKDPADVVKCLKEVFEDQTLTPEFFRGLVNSNDYFAVSDGCKAAIEIILAVAGTKK